MLTENFEYTLTRHHEGDVVKKLSLRLNMLTSVYDVRTLCHFPTYAVQASE